jgi:hypothetical protein
MPTLWPPWTPADYSSLPLPTEPNTPTILTPCVWTCSCRRHWAIALLNCHSTVFFSIIICHSFGPVQSREWPQYGIGDKRARVRILAEINIFSSLKTPAGSVIHPYFYTVVNEGYFPEVKAAGPWSLPPHTAGVKSGGATPPLPMSSSYGTLLKIQWNTGTIVDTFSLVFFRHTKCSHTSAVAP